VTVGYYFVLTMDRITHVRFEHERYDIEDFWRDTYAHMKREGSIYDNSGRVVFDGRASEQNRGEGAPE
jgi:hypothetical protein